MARVVSLFVSPGIGQPMQPRTFVRALAGRGLHGDRYALGQGSYSNLPRPAARHISLIAREAIEASNEELVRRELTHLNRGKHDEMSSSKASTSMHCSTANFVLVPYA